MSKNTRWLLIGVSAVVVLAVVLTIQAVTKTPENTTTAPPSTVVTDPAEDPTDEETYGGKKITGIRIDGDMQASVEDVRSVPFIEADDKKREEAIKRVDKYLMTFKGRSWKDERADTWVGKVKPLSTKKWQKKLKERYSDTTDPEIWKGEQEGGLQEESSITKRAVYEYVPGSHVKFEYTLRTIVSWEKAQDSFVEDGEQKYEVTVDVSEGWLVDKVVVVPPSDEGAPVVEGA